MPPHTLFHVVFLCQVILVSFLLPRKLLARMNHIQTTYPPEQYPRLYPMSAAYYARRRRVFVVGNAVMFAAGLALLGALLMTPRTGSWDHVIAMWYFFAQVVPVLLFDLSSLRLTREMRRQSPTRKASLEPRRVTDFISPALLGLTVATYLVFAAFIVYMRQFDYPWFGGYANIVGITIGNAVLAAVFLGQLYGRKRNPHEAPEDRHRSLETVARMCAFVSIAATAFIGLNIMLAAADLRALQPAAQSIYFQLIAILGFRVYLVEHTNFDVYKAGSAVV